MLLPGGKPLDFNATSFFDELPKARPVKKDTGSEYV